MIGVVIESAAVLFDLFENHADPDKCQLAAEPVISAILTRWWSRPNRKLVTEIVGCVLVALGVSLELYAESERAGVETKLRGNNAATQVELTKRENDATASAVETAQKVGGLSVLVKDTDEKVDALKKTASEQKTRSEALIIALTEKEREVAATIEAAQKDENALRASADTIRELRQKIHDLTADRVLTDQQSNDLTLAAKPLRHVEFDASAALTSEAWTFAKQIGLALQVAGWEWKPRPMFPALALKGVPDVGNDTREGLILEACKSDVAALDSSAKFIRDQLLRDGFAFTGSWYEDNDAEVKSEPCGRLHIIVGSKY